MTVMSEVRCVRRLGLERDACFCGMSLKLCVLKKYQWECHNYIFLWENLLNISYCAKYSIMDTNNSLTFSLEIPKDINCIAYALKVCFI